MSGKESSSDDDSEGPDQVDSDDQVELMETEQGIFSNVCLEDLDKHISR